MRKIFLFLLPLIVAMPLSGQVSVFQSTNTVTATGTIGAGEWDDASAAINIATLGSGFTAPTDSSDLSGTVRLKWDSINLYALFQITDDIRGENSADGISTNLNSFNDDSVELNFEGTFPGSAVPNHTLDGLDRFQYRFNPNSNALLQEIEFSPIDTPSTDIVWGTQDTVGNSYVVEVSNPWSTLNVTTPTIGNSFAFMGVINDDDGSERETQLFWNTSNSNAWDDATEWSEIQLAAAIPEPSTYAMIFGLVGFVASVIVVKRRKATE